jgi:formylmethanofuran dehydrogenase subunit E
MVPQPTLEGIIEFHGHMCAGLAMGIRAAEVALEEIGAHSPDEEVVAIVETDMCGVDAIQFLTGCTFGKGNLVHRDFGKNAYTFIRRSDGKAIRLSPTPRSALRDPAWFDLFAKMPTTTRPNGPGSSPTSSTTSTPPRDRACMTPAHGSTDHPYNSGSGGHRQRGKRCLTRH